MGAPDGSPPDLMQRLQSSTGASSSSGNRRFGIPPSHPHFPPSPSPAAAGAQIAGQGVYRHSRSLSQPGFFSFDSLPPLSPPTFREPASSSLSDPITGADVAMDDCDGSASSQPPPSAVPPGSPSPFSKCTTLQFGGGGGGEGLPPKKTHRRSVSDIPFSFSGGAQGSFFQIGSAGIGAPKPVKREFGWSGGVEGLGGLRLEDNSADDDLFSAYMNLDFINSSDSGPMEKSQNEHRDELDSRASGTKTCGAESSENEAESRMKGSDSGMNFGLEKKGAPKRSFGADGNGSAGPRHCRSISMDSFMGNLPNFGDELVNMQPSPRVPSGQHSRSNSLDGNSGEFGVDLGNGEFSGTELKKIMANEKLAEIAVSDPRRAKRILANRQSAARSKERKVRYISELEHKVQTLQTEATTLSAQLTMLQRESSGLTSHNNELRFRLQAMEQQAHLRDALNEALTSEIQRLKIAAQELSASNSNNRLGQQLHVNPQLYQIRQQPMQPSSYQLQQQPPHQQQLQQQPEQQNQQHLQQPQEQTQHQQNSTATKHEQK